jgi:peptide/nickel transport system permease protein
MRKQPQKKSQAKDIWHRMNKNKAAMIGLVILIIIVFFALAADVIADYNEMAIKQNILERLKPPSRGHWFGTDGFGRDTFSRVIHGSRVSLSIGLLAVGFSVIIGSVLGSAAGYFGGIADNVIMRIMDTMISIPPILLALAIMAALGHGMRNLIIALSISYVPFFARVVRASVLSVVGQDFIEAGKACGTKDGAIILKHVLPNAIGPIIVQATMSVSSVIIAAAGLSFIGMGIQPPRPEWGSMLAEGKEFMRYSPYLVAFPGLAIVLAALSINLLGDGLRDVLDPRLRD